MSTRWLASAVALALALAASAPARADGKLPEPARHEVRSPNGAFAAEIDPQMGVRVFDLRGKARVLRWRMRGWFRVAALADDGDHLVTGYFGQDLLDLDHKPDEVMLTFWERGKVIAEVRLDQLVRDRSKLERTASHYFWGSFLGLDAKGCYRVQTVEKKQLGFDAKTGRPCP
jgi:hypothetical protein